ncbi:CBS domain-containing protein [Nocardia stercoris]|uniref:CBS domain-containing protein n=1 Tax=Nocardia stercoris TaxID=2483361 RepID=UPI0018F77272|nr:CBS domain-containing protein [Nocardia stercoris]
MTRYVRDLMTDHPVSMAADRPVREAARAMRDGEIGTVLVVDGDRIQASSPIATWWSGRSPTATTSPAAAWVTSAVRI